MFVDGLRTGPVGSVTGCRALFITTEFNSGGNVTTFVQPNGYQPCEITIGADAGAKVFDWLNTEMSGNFAQHQVDIAQYIPASRGGFTPGTEIKLDRAVITKFSLPPIDSKSSTLFEASMELQSVTQKVTTAPSPALTAGESLAPHKFQSSTLTDTVQNIRGTMPAETISQPYIWSLDVTKVSNGSGGFSLTVGAAQTNTLMFTTPGTATNTIIDLQAWQKLIVDGRPPAPRTASFTVTAPAGGTKAAQTLTVDLTRVQLTSPLDAIENPAGDFAWGVHADGIAVSLT
jgi:hypothetical protein